MNMTLLVPSYILAFGMLVPLELMVLPLGRVEGGRGKGIMQGVGWVDHCVEINDPFY